jgi:lysophospholipid acyltransferase (LPLAT)-like uncharacterized protein
MPSLKRMSATPAFQNIMGTLGAGYLKLVWRTSRVILDPPEIYETIRPPVIIAAWHGQHFMLPFIRKPEHRAKVLISRHRDGEINARAAERLGVETIRGSGAHNGEFARKGGAAALGEMVQALDEGYNVAMTADVPKVARVCGMGVIKLAQYSGRPIYPVAVATSRHIELDNWDKSAINLPFSRLSMVTDRTPIEVARDADSAALETARQAVEDALNRLTRHAYDLAAGKRSGAS